MRVRAGSTLERIHRLVTSRPGIDSKPEMIAFGAMSGFLLPGLSTGMMTALITAAFVISDRGSSHAA